MKMANSVPRSPLFLFLLEGWLCNTTLSGGLFPLSSSFLFPPPCAGETRKKRKRREKEMEETLFRNRSSDRNLIESCATGSRKQNGKRKRTWIKPNPNFPFYKLENKNIAILFEGLGWTSKSTVSHLRCFLKPRHSLLPNPLLCKIEGDNSTRKEEEKMESIHGICMVPHKANIGGGIFNKS